MDFHLLTYVQEAKWAILDKSLLYITDIVQDHDLILKTTAFHQKDGDMKSVIGTIGTPIDGTNFSTRAGNVGILHVDGPIIPRSVNTISSGPSASLQTFTKELKLMDENPDIKNIIMSFDTPGGMVTGVSEFVSFIRTLETPVTSFVYGYAASAGLWIATQGKEIVIAATAEMGSLGTVAIMEDRTEADAKKGIKRFEVVSNLSQKKRLDPTEGEGRENLIETLDDITTLFASDVAKGRKMETQDVLNNFGKGKMFIASKAIDIGMADRLGTLDSLVTELNSKSNTLAGGLMADANTPLTAEEYKASNPSAYDNIVALGAKAEQGRLKSIDELILKDSSVSSFVNERKYDADMNKASMALAIFEARDDINADAATKIKKNGSALTKKLETVASHAETVEANEDDSKKSKFDLAAVKEGAEQMHKEKYGVTAKEQYADKEIV